ncbi:hypothetical protein HXX76_012034 [Chlamydomonas incerta]|uniref:Uncharacterized protein n=1 Tax=Chlamydomonas incerta TaxID=51695 RepID=A0A835VWT9_CHLIN|nr:hypothetical protein HXX76_012034 [Chlamydomonas incerta]|eukprot:KAG2428051.1 hypothetical protein HXX76_012034 [Chlamydomonas incerta]
MVLLVCIERRKKDATPLVGASMANRKAASSKGFQVDPMLQPAWQKNMALIKQKQGGMTMSLKQFAPDPNNTTAAHMAAREQALEMVMRAPSATPDPHALPAYLTKQLGPRVSRRAALAANAWGSSENQNGTSQTKFHTVSGAIATDLEGDRSGSTHSGGNGPGGAAAAAAPSPTKVRFERWSQPAAGLQRPEPAAAAAQLPSPLAAEMSNRSVLCGSSIVVHTGGAGDDDDDRPSRSSVAAGAIIAGALAVPAGSGAGTPTSVSSRRLYHQQSQQQFLQQQQQQLSPQPQERPSNRSSGSANWAAALSSPPPLAANAVAPAPSHPGTPTAAASTAASPSQVGLSASRRLHQQTFGDSGRGSSPATPNSNGGTPAGFSRHGSRDVLGGEAPGGSGGTAGGSASTAPVTEDVLPMGPEGGAAAAGGSSGGAGPSSGRGVAPALRTAANMRGPSRLGSNYGSPQQPAMAAGAVQWPSLAIDEAADEGAAAGVRVAVTSPGEVVHDSDLLPGAAASPAPPCLMSPGSKHNSISGQHHSNSGQASASAAAMLHSTTMTPSLRAALGSAAPPPLAHSPHLGKLPDNGPASAPARAAAAASHPAANSPLARGANAGAAAPAAATASGAYPAAGRVADGPQARRASMMSIESEFNELKEQFSSQSRWLLEQLAGGPEPPSGPPRGMPPLPELGDDDDVMPLPTAAPPRAMPRRAVTLTSAATSAAATQGGVRLGAGAGGADVVGGGVGAGGMKGGISASGGLESGPAGAGYGFAAAAAAGKSLRRQTSDAPVKSHYGGAYNQLAAMWNEHKAAQQQQQPPPQVVPSPSPPRAYRASEPNEPISYRALQQAAGAGAGGGGYRQQQQQQQLLQPQPPPQQQRLLPAGVPRPVQLSWSASGETVSRASPTGGGAAPTSFAGAGQGRSPGGAGGAGAAASPSKASGPLRLSPGGSGLPPRPPAL